MTNDDIKKNSVRCDVKEYLEVNGLTIMVHLGLLQFLQYVSCFFAINMLLSESNLSTN